MSWFEELKFKYPKDGDMEIFYKTALVPRVMACKALVDAGKWEEIVDLKYAFIGEMQFLNKRSVVVGNSAVVKNLDPQAAAVLAAWAHYLLENLGVRVELRVVNAAESDVLRRIAIPKFDARDQAMIANLGIRDESELQVTVHGRYPQRMLGDIFDLTKKLLQDGKILQQYGAVFSGAAV